MSEQRTSTGNGAQAQEVTALVRIGRHYFTQKNCAVCGAEFLSRRDKQSKNGGCYCSKLCAGKARRVVKVPLVPVPYADRLRARFESFVAVDVDDLCWNWIGATVKAPRSNYEWGVISIHNRARKASRVSWELHNGPIPQGQQVLHDCDNGLCVNPAHLFLGTPLDNVADMDRKGRRRTISVSGVKHWKAKLTTQQVIRIRQHIGPARLLASVLGVTPEHVNAIRRGEHRKGE